MESFVDANTPAIFAAWQMAVDENDDDALNALRLKVSRFAAQSSLSAKHLWNEWNVQLAKATTQVS
jgi:hypothetical protein